MSLLPELASLPVIGKGANCMPTIHVSDLTNAIDRIITQGHDYSSYLIAVDESTTQTQKEIMQTISDGIGNGMIKEISIQEAIKESWCEFMTVNVQLEASPCLQDAFDWKYPNGINPESMADLNTEFNYFRGLFPLKVFITGPPCSGKTHFAKKLNDLYGVPHLKIEDIVTMGKQLTTEYGETVRARVEELKDQAEAEYEKTRKKKDPDFDRETCNPRLPDDVIWELVKIQLNSAGCMNKGFILEGFPRSWEDASSIFVDKVPKEVEPKPEGEEEEGEEPEP